MRQSLTRAKTTSSIRKQDVPLAFSLSPAPYEYKVPTYLLSYATPSVSKRPNIMFARRRRANCVPPGTTPEPWELQSHPKSRVANLKSRRTR